MFDDFVDQATARGRTLPHRRLRAEAADGTLLMAGVVEPRRETGTGRPEPDPAKVSEVVILYHGAGANMNVGYIDLAIDIVAGADVAVLLPDTRGHGMSKGARGYAQNRTDVWEDIDAWVAKAEETWPGRKVTLMGHSAGAAQILNRLTQLPKSIAPSVQRFVGIAPYFASTGRLLNEGGVDLQAFELPTFSRRSDTPVDGVPEPYVVQFNYPGDVARICNLVQGYTAEMSAALSPRDIDTQLRSLSLPTTIIMAEDDELFPVKGLTALIARAGNPKVQAHALPGGHLGCLFTLGSEIAAHLTPLELAA